MVNSDFKNLMEFSVYPNLPPDSELPDLLFKYLQDFGAVSNETRPTTILTKTFGHVDSFN